MSRAPEEVRAMAAERERSRARKDFAEADELRRRIHEAGYEVTDTPEGSVLSPRPAVPPSPTVHRRSEEVPSLLAEPPRFEASVQWVAEGWPDDVVRGIASFDRFAPAPLQHVVVDLVGLDPGWPDEADVVRLASGSGWAAARNAALRRSSGRIVVIADGSVEATGDVVTVLASALEDPTVGLTGPFGIVTEDLREFHESDGPEVDAVEAYLMAMPRRLVEEGLRFDEKFRFYRSADIELSFQVKAGGLRATVTPVPVIRHEHRVWEATPEAERARLSKRNFYRFLDRWRGRGDLLAHRPEG